ncbi:MAG: hypothetical protein R3316_07995 [Rhodovibrionaceae bacterium]|nr:hypothetical protein [Rhodovibrionaceae bacterium]
MPFVQEDQFHPFGATEERPGIATPRQTSGGKMPLWSTFGRSVGAIFGFLPSLLKAAVFPIALHLALLAPPLVILSDRLVAAIESGTIDRRFTHPPDLPLAVATVVIFLLVSFTATSLFFGSWSRLLALGPDRAAVSWLPEWGRRGWRIIRMRFFAFLCLIVAALFAAVGAQGALILEPEPWALAPGVVGAVLALASVILAVRISVGTAAAAMNDPWLVDETLRATRRHNFRLLFGSLLVATLGGLVAAIFFTVVALGAAAALHPDPSGIRMEHLQSLLVLHGGDRGTVQLAVLAAGGLFSWYVLRACLFAFQTQAYLFFRRSPHAPGRSTSSVAKRFEPSLESAAAQGTRSGGAWPGDLTRYEAGASEREEDWVDAADPRRGGLPAEEIHAGSRNAGQPYDDLWRKDEQADPEMPRPTPGETQPTPPAEEPAAGDASVETEEQQWRRGADLFRALRREPTYDDAGDDADDDRGDDDRGDGGGKRDR